MSEFIATHAMQLSACILVITYIFIAWEKIPKSVTALLGACVTLLLGFVGQEKFLDGQFNPHYFINFIDFNVIFLLVSMMIIVGIIAKSGVFGYIANLLLKYTKGKPILLLAALGIFTAVASAFLDNVTTVILIMPVTFFIARKLEIDPVPFLFTEIFASNIGGTATLIGDPPNIIIGSAAGFSFMDFVNNLTGVIAVILIAMIALMVLCFKNKMKTSEEKMREVANVDNTGVITDKNLMIRSLTVLGLVILGFVTHDITHIQTGVIAMLGASVLLVFEKPTEVFKEVEWNTILFFIGLFIIIGGVEASGGIKQLAQWVLDITHGSQTAASMLILWTSGIVSGVIDNIPYTATMAPMIAEIAKVEGASYALPLWWCLSLGACLGGNLTIIGAAANVIVSEFATKENHPISFMRFMKYGSATVFVSLLISTGYIWLRYLR